MEVMEKCKYCYRSRPKKRQALSYIFSKIEEFKDEFDKKFIYITLGESEILDVIDLMNICYIEEIKKIYSFEKDRKIAELAKKSTIYNIFNNWHSEKIYRDKLRVINSEFPIDLDKYIENGQNKIIYYDITGWFNFQDSEIFSDLMKREIIMPDDLVLITSSQHSGLGWYPIKPKTIQEFKLYYGENKSSINDEILRNNIVDIFLYRSLRQYNFFDKKVNGSKRQMSAKLIDKVNYRDTVLMGLWAFKFTTDEDVNLKIPCDFSKSFIGENEAKSLLGGIFSGK